MRKILSVALVLAGAFLFAPAARAQFTTTAASVQDPNGIPYAGAVLNAVLVPSTGGGYTLSGQPYSGRIGPVTLDSAGKFTVNFGDVTLISPGSPQWQITIDSTAATIAGPLGTGPQSFTYTSTGTTISGSSPVSLTTALNALAPKLTNFATGGSGTVTSIAASAPIVVTPSPIIATGTISCPTCNTSGATIAGAIANTQVAFGTASNTIGGNAGFTFVTPNMTIPTNGIYQINGANFLSPGPVAGNNNLGVGPSTISALTTGPNNVAVGPFALNLTTTGQDNTAVGVGALFSLGAANQKNTAVGNGALQNATSDNNVAVGQNAGFTGPSTGNNTLIGTGAGQGMTTGGNNTFVGELAASGLTTGSSNIVLGITNLLTTGSGNLVIGNAVSGITGSSNNQMTIMDVLIGTGMNTPATSTITDQGIFSSALYATKTNCSSSASPAVCAAAAAGSVVIAAGATTVTVNTTATTANSQIDVTPDDTLGTKLSVTCNSTLATLIGGLAITARTAGTSFQITSGATPAVNPLCISYHITN